MVRAALAVVSGVAAAIILLVRRKSLLKPRSWYDSLPVFCLRNKGGMEVTISAMGASILKLIVPDAKGHKADIVLGYQGIEQYVVRELFQHHSSS